MTRTSEVLSPRLYETFIRFLPVGWPLVFLDQVQLPPSAQRHYHQQRQKEFQTLVKELDQGTLHLDRNHELRRLVFASDAEQYQWQTLVRPLTWDYFERMYCPAESPMTIAELVADLEHRVAAGTVHGHRYFITDSAFLTKVALGIMAEITLTVGPKYEEMQTEQAPKPLLHKYPDNPDVVRAGLVRVIAEGIAEIEPWRKPPKVKKNWAWTLEQLAKGYESSQGELSQARQLVASDHIKKIISWIRGYPGLSALHRYQTIMYLESMFSDSA